MLIFLDTNIFYNNWHLRNANFSLLFNYINNTSSTIVISEIVCSEINNKLKQERDHLLATLHSVINKISRVSEEDFIIDVKSPICEYNFKDVITSKTDNAVFYHYDNIDIRTLVARAIDKTKPFQDQDKGFRDTLIWLSFLNYLKENEISDDVIFINNNSSDFYIDKLLEFHNDLRNDLEKKQVKNKFEIYKDLHSFVTSTIDVTKHTLKVEEVEERYIYDKEQEIQVELSYLISQLEILNAVKIFSKTKEIEKVLSSTSSVKFEIVEGLEDIYLLNYKILNNKKLIFIELNFNLRICEIQYILPTSIYNHFFDLLQSRFFNPEEMDNETKFYDYLRIDFNISYNFNLETNKIQDLIVNDSRIMK